MPALFTRGLRRNLMIAIESPFGFARPEPADPLQRKETRPSGTDKTRNPIYQLRQPKADNLARTGKYGNFGHLARF